MANQIIDLRKRLKPEKSGLVQGLEGLLGGLITGQKKQANEKRVLDKDLLRTQRKRDEKQLTREQEILSDTTTLVNRNIPIEEAIEIAQIDNQTIRNSEMKKKINPSILDSLLENASGFIKSITAPQQQQPVGLGALDQLDPTGQQQQEDPTQEQQQLLQQLDPTGQQQQVDPTEQLQEQKKPVGIGEQIARDASQFGTGAATTLAGIPGDFASLLDKLIPSIERNKEEVGESIKQLESKRDESEPGSVERRQADRILESLKKEPERLFEELQKTVPTSEKIREEIVPSLTKGTILEPFTVANSAREKNLQKFGGITGLLAKTAASPGGTLLNIAKAAGVAVAGEAAGWMTEKATGSKTAGNIVTNGTYLLYAASPGLPKGLAKQKFSEWTNKVVKPAAAQNKLVNMSSTAKKLENISERIGTFFGEGNPSGPKLDTEVEFAKALGLNPTPQAVQNHLTRMSKSFPKVDDQAKGIFSEIKDAVREPLVSFSNKMSKDGGKLLTDANELFSIGKVIDKDMASLKNVVSVRNAGLGTIFWLTGALKPFLAGAVGVKGAKYVSRLFASQAWRNASTQLLKASAAQNISLINKIIPKVDKQAEKVLSKSPKKTQDEIRKAIDDAKKKL